MSGERPQRVVVLVKRFPRLSETFILNEFLELRRQGVPVELAAIMDSGERLSHPAALALAPEVTYLQSGRMWRSLPAAARTAVRHPWGTLKAAGWVLTRHTYAAVRNFVHALVLLDRLAAGKPAHVHAHFLHSPAAIAFIAHKVGGQRYSLTGHAKDIYTTLPENLRMRCREAEFVTTCTEANVRFLVGEIGLPASHVTLCGHGVDASLFEAQRHDGRPGRILSVGRLVPKKGFDVLVRACGELARRGVDFELRIVGSGEQRDDLMALAAAEGIADRVQLPGSMTQAEVSAELAAAELFALSPVVMPDGDRDGIPNVVLEAMAAGVPVVTTAVSGIPEVVTDRVGGRLIPPGRPDLLADALAELRADAAQAARLAANAQQFVREERSWPAVVQPLKRLLETSLAPGAERRRSPAPPPVPATSGADGT